MYLYFLLAFLAIVFNVKVKLAPDGLAVCFYATMTSHACVPVTWHKHSVKRFARAVGVTAVSGSDPPSLCLWCGFRETQKQEVVVQVWSHSCRSRTQNPSALSLNWTLTFH